MRIGVVCAMENEIDLLRGCFQSSKLHRAGGIAVTEAPLFSHTLLLAISGIGKTSAAMTTEALITAFNCEIIINTGLAGGCDDRLQPGDAVLADKAVYHDFDLGALRDLHSFPDGFLPDRKLFSLAERAMTKLGACFVSGTVASGDVFVSDKALKDEIIARTRCSCIDMEAAAIAHVASLNALPFTIVKYISDSADLGAELDFDAALSLYTKRCAAFVREIVKLI